MKTKRLQVLIFEEKKNSHDIDNKNDDLITRLYWLVQAQTLNANNIPITSKKETPALKKIVNFEQFTGCKWTTWKYVRSLSIYLFKHTHTRSVLLLSVYSVSPRATINNVKI